MRAITSSSVTGEASAALAISSRCAACSSARPRDQSATAGGVVFYGTMEGWLKALDQKSGKTLWQYNTPSGIIGNPMTYVGPDGKQYVAILSGVGGWSGIGMTAELGVEDPTAGLGAVGKGQLDFGGVGHHMKAGEDRAIRVGHNARP